MRSCALISAASAWSTTSGSFPCSQRISGRPSSGPSPASASSGGGALERPPPERLPDPFGGRQPPSLARLNKVAPVIPPPGLNDFQCVWISRAPGYLAPFDDQ